MLILIFCFCKIIKIYTYRTTRLYIIEKEDTILLAWPFVTSQWFTEVKLYCILLLLGNNPSGTLIIASIKIHKTLNYYYYYYYIIYRHKKEARFENKKKNKKNRRLYSLLSIDLHSSSLAEKEFFSLQQHRWNSRLVCLLSLSPRWKLSTWYTLFNVVRTYRYERGNTLYNTTV